MTGDATKAPIRTPAFHDRLIEVAPLVADVVVVSLVVFEAFVTLVVA